MLNENVQYLKDKTSKLTTSPGVYLMKDAKGKIIYIGKAKNLKNRVSSYFRESSNHNAKTLKMVSQVADYDFIVTDSEYECLLLECSLIKQHRPKYNVLLKDSKGYSYVKVSRGEYPRITVVHQKHDDGVYVGVYTSSVVAKHAVDEVNRAFKLPTCNRAFPRDFNRNGKRPCLNYHIDRCMGVCQGTIPKSQYLETVHDAIEYLKNGSESSIERLTQRMLTASQNLEFEKAIALRDRIEYIKKSAQPQKVRDVDVGDSDYIGKVVGVDCTVVSILKYRDSRLFDKEDYYLGTSITGESVLESFILQYYSNRVPTELPKNVYVDEPIEGLEHLSKAVGVKVLYRQRGEEAKYLAMAKSNASEYLSIREGRTSKELRALERLSKAIGLDSVPNRVEAYDVSNVGSQVMVGSMVVFENGRPDRQSYRKFSIDDVPIQNDYACMERILSRRLAYLVDGGKHDESFSQQPDLIFVDGGSTHVAVAKSVLAKFGLDIPTFGIVKDGKHHTRAISADGGEVVLSKLDDAFRLLATIQDEMHRVAISYARDRHRKGSLVSQLTQVKGIGQKKATAIMLHYKTTQALKATSVEELRSVAGVSYDTAKNLLEYILQNVY